MHTISRVVLSASGFYLSSKTEIGDTVVISIHCFTHGAINCANALESSRIGGTEGEKGVLPKEA